MRLFQLALLFCLSVAALSQPVAAGRYCSHSFEELDSTGAAPHFGPEAPDYVSPSRNFDMIHTRLELDIELEQQFISGSVTHTIDALRPEVDKIELHCVDLTVTDVQVAAAESDPAVLPAVTSWSQYESLDTHQHSLIINLDPPASYGQRLVLRIQYHGKPTYGLFFIHEEGGNANRRWEAWTQGEGENNRHWIPSFDYPNDKATFEGIFRVPKGNFALSNGVLVNEHDLGDKTEYQWFLDTPQVNYLIALAVSDYEIHRDEWRGIPLMYLVPPGTGAETVNRCYGKTPEMLSFFTDTIGIDFPFRSYNQVVVQDFIVGGMENTTAVLMNERSLFDDRTKLTRDADSLIAHELVHMWWGDMVTLREWNGMWLNEGFATYFEKLWMANDHGDDAFRLAMAATHESVVSRDDNSPLPMVVDFFNRTGWRSNANVYIKGSSVLHMLRHDLGDELFFRVIKKYGEDHKYGFAETADLMRVVKEVTGENMDWFFEQWVYLAGHPKLEVSKHWDGSSGILTLTVRQTQEVDGLVPVFRLPVDVEVTTADGPELFSIMVDEAEQDYHFHLDAKPEMVIFDKGDWLLKTLTFNKNRAELLYQLEHGDAIAKLRAVHGLKKYRDDADIIAVLDKVIHGDDHYKIRQAAVGIYDNFPSDRTAELLLSALSTDEARVRLTATQRAGYTRDRQEVEDRLKELLDTEPSYTVRAAAVTSLVDMKAESAFAACLNALAQDSDRHEVRVAALNGLRRLEAVDALEEIRPYCGRGNSRWYRHTALDTYARLTAMLDDEDAKTTAAEYLHGMLNDSYHRTRESVIRALEQLGDKSSVEALRNHAAAERVSWIADRAEAAANRIEAMRPDQLEIEELEAQLKDLEDQFNEIQRRLGELDKRVGD